MKFGYFLIFLVATSVLAQRKPNGANEERALKKIREVMEDDFKQSLLACATGLSYITSLPDYKKKVNLLISQCTDEDIKENLQEVRLN